LALQSLKAPIDWGGGLAAELNVGLFILNFTSK